MTLRRELGLTLVALAVSATGCAPMATKPGPAAAGAPPASATHVPAPTPTHSTSPGTATSTSPATAAIDSTTPSPAAQRVLGSIPEPLTPAQQALSAQAAPVDTSRMRAVAPAAAYDSLQAAPVPAATQPLGTETSTVTMDTSTTAPALSAAGGAASSTAAAGAATGAATGAAAASTASAAPASIPAATSGPCWRLQVGAPLASEKDKADSRREAAQSQLMTPFTIVPEKGYLKVRTSDCMSREDADALKKRAVDSGFGDAFLLDSNAAPPAAAPATKHAHVPASKRKK